VGTTLPQCQLSAGIPGSVPIPSEAGVGLRHPHLEAFVRGEPDIAWLEVHSENFIADGGPRVAALEDIRQHYPISCHGVGLSLGSAEGIDADHLDRLRTLFKRIQPALVSEHISWSINNGTYLNDLLPIPYTGETLRVLSQNVAQVQDYLGCRLLVENPSTYLTFNDSDFDEPDFITQLITETGCGLLLDINNIYVSSINNGFDPIEYINKVPSEAVMEIHLAGHSSEGEGDECVLIDTHNNLIASEVWSLYELALDLLGPRPVLVEWDADIPEINVLVSEANKAQKLLSTRIQM